MTAETPRVGDMVRMTHVNGDTTTTVTGPATMDPWGDHLQVGGVRCHPAPEGWTVEVIERALPPEPPIGSIGATVVDAIVRRGWDGQWYYEASGNAVADTWPTLHKRTTILRSGPAPEATP